jgi:hypothetical protein
MDAFVAQCEGVPMLLLRAASLGFVGFALAACGSATTTNPTSPADDATPRAGDIDPAKEKADAPPEMEATPYTAEQIRDATHAGRKYVFSVEAAGAPAKRKTMRFLGADASGALIESETSNADGSGVVAEPASHATWGELRDHAQFPKAVVARSETITKTRAGDFACLVYTVRGKDGETTTFHFAKNLPGPPVLFSTEKDGKVVMKSELVEYKDGGAGDVAAAGTAKIVSLKMAMKLEGDVDEKALVAALQPQLAPLDACAKLIARGSEGPGSLNARITLTGQGAVTVELESPVPPDAKKCFENAFAGWKVDKAGTGKSMILLELAQ